MAGDAAPAGPASAVMGFVGSVVEKVTAPIDALNLAVGKATYAFVLMLPSFPAARLWSDLVFQFGHSHPHPPTFGFPLPSFGPILASGSQSVLINGLPAARCGDLGLSVWCGGYVPIFEVLTGSSHVFIGGARASRMLFDLTFHCLPDPFAGLGKVAKVQKFLTVGEILGAGIGAGMSLLGAAAAAEGQSAAQNEASDAAAQAEAAALAASDSAAIEAQMQAMMAGLSADDAANRAAAAGVAASTAIAQAAADIAALAMSILMGKDPGIGFPLGMIITGSPNVHIGGFPMPGWMTILRGLFKMLQPVLRRVQMKLPSGRLKKALCFLTGDPVEVASGRVVTEEVDFEFSGRIPIVFERSYDTSSIDYEGPLGWGWTHSFDQHLWCDRQQRAVIWRDDEGRVVGFNPLAVTEKIYHPLERVWLERTGEREYVLEDLRRGRWLKFGAVNSSDAISDPAVGHSEAGALRLLEILDRNQNRIQLAYTNGRLRSIEDDVGLRLLFEYIQLPHGRGRLKEVRRALDGREARSTLLVQYDYNEFAELSSVTDRTHVPLRYYYSNHLLIRRMTRNGLNFYFEYDSAERDARCIHTWGDGGIYERWLSYQPRSRYTVVRDSLGGATTYHYNELDQVTRVINPMGGTRKYQYGQAGELLVEEDELLRKRAYLYDEFYNRIGVVAEDGTMRRVEYDESAQPVLVEDEMGGQWKREYDERGNVVATIDPLGARREYEYSARGDITSVRDSLGSLTRFEWTLQGQISSMIGPSGGRTSYSYDSERRVTEVREEAARTSLRYEYDQAGRLQRRKETDLRGQTFASWRYDYDPDGNITQTADPSGNVTRHKYGGFDRVVERQDGLGYHRRFQYDSEERLTGIENERGERYSIEYDLLDSTLREVGFDGRRREYEYNSAGQMIREIDAAGRETQYVRDATGLMVKRILSDLSSVEYSYDACGRLIAARNSVSETQFEYDACWRIIREKQNGQSIEHKYDSEGRRIERRIGAVDADPTALNLEDQRLVSYEYDREGELLAISTAGHGARFELDQARRVDRRILTNGIEERIAYDEAGRPRRQAISHLREGGELVRREYQWDGAGNIISFADNLRGERRFDYDATDRLQRVKRLSADLLARTEDRGRTHMKDPAVPEARRLWAADDKAGGRQPAETGHVENFSFDGAGNLLARSNGASKRLTYETGNRLVRMNDVVYFYDAVGNLVEKQRAGGETIRYEYDADDQLIAVDSSAGGRIEFEYDVLGRRIMKRTATAEIGFLWDGDVLLGENRKDSRNPEAEVEIEYVHEPAGFVPVLRLKRKGTSTAEIENYHVDYLGTPRELTDATGAIVWLADYDEYGKVSVVQGSTDQSIRFQGQYEDTETGLSYNRLRYYDPETGRYISQDPIGLRGGLNPYEYAHNPLGWMDPLGLNECKADLIRRNQEEGAAREVKVRKQLKKEFPDSEVLEQRYLRDSKGKRLIDPETGEARRLDFVVVKDGRVRRMVEVTSMDAPKGEQLAKSQRIRALGDESGGTYIRDPKTKELIRVPKNIKERVVRLD